MAFTIKKCVATEQEITLYFSDDINFGLPHPSFTVTDTTSGNTYTPAGSVPPNTTREITLPAGGAAVGDWVLVKITGLTSKDGEPLRTSTVAGVVVDTKTEQITETVLSDPRIRSFGEAVEDAVSYPILTEPIGFAAPSGGGSALGQPSVQSGAPLSSVVGKALTDVLGWKVNQGDAKGFVGALNQAFTLTEVEGRTEASWSPRTYAVQTDLGGGITGAQASLYTRASDALNKCLPLLDGLYPLDAEAEPEDVTALRELAKSQLGEIVKEFGAVGGPSVLRVDTYFQILLGTAVPATATAPADADHLNECTLRSLRDAFGIAFVNNRFSNSIEDEQDITNFRIVVDYVISLFQTWVNNRQFFTLGNANQSAFFGTQLVLISRQLSVILETVNEVRFALDSVFIGPSERQTLLLQFQGDDPPPIFIEDLLNELQDFFADEGPRLLRDGGRLAVKNNILPVVSSFSRMAEGARRPANLRQLPDGYRTARVRRALDDLSDQIKELRRLVKPVQRELPPAELSGGRLLAVPSALALPPGSASGPRSGAVTVVNIGNGNVTGLHIQLSPDTTGFVLPDQQFPTTLLPNAAVSVTVNCVTGQSAQTGKLLIASDNQDPITVRLSVELAGAAGGKK